MNEDDNLFTIPFEEFLRLRGGATSNALSETRLSSAKSIDPGSEKTMAIAQLPEPGHHSDAPFDWVSQSTTYLDHQTSVETNPQDASENYTPSATDKEIEALLSAILNSPASGTEVADQAGLESGSAAGPQAVEQSDSIDVSATLERLQSRLADDEGLAAEEKRRLHKEVTVAQKRLSDHERRILELRRIHRQTHKRILKAEDHVRHLIEKERQRNDIARKQTEEQEQLLNDMRSETAQAEEKLSILRAETELEQAKLEELDRANAEEWRKLDDLRRQQKRLEENQQQLEESCKLLTQEESENARVFGGQHHVPSLEQENGERENSVDGEKLQPTDSGQVADTRTVQPQNSVRTLSNQSIAIPPQLHQQLNDQDPAVRGAALKEVCVTASTADAFQLITQSFDDPSTQVQKAALSALLELQQDRAAALTQALRESTPERRCRIGKAIAESGLAEEAIQSLIDERAARAHEATKILFLMCKAGEFQPLIRAVEEHPNVAIRLRAITLLASSAHCDVVSTLRKVAVRASLPSEVRSGALSALQQICSVPRSVPTSSS